MNRRKIAPLLLNNEEPEASKKTFVDINIIKKKKKLPIGNIIIIFIFLGAGAFYYLNHKEINNTITEALGGEIKPSISMPTFNSEDKKNEQEISHPSSVDMQKAMQEKETENNKNIINKEDTSYSMPQEQIKKEDDFPTVNINPTPTENNPITVAQNTESLNPQENNQSSQIMLQKELNMLLKNSTFSINAKKENISIFISNMNYNIGESILNNNKFKLSNITMSCENNKMPTFSVEIADSLSNNILLTKELKFSDNKKIILAFDSLSITDLGSNTENIYLPGEMIFKDFYLKNILEKQSNLSFEFECGNKTINIDGKELSTVE